VIEQEVRPSSSPTVAVYLCIARRAISAPIWLVKPSAIKEVDEGIWLVSFIDYDLGIYPRTCCHTIRSPVND